MAMTLKSVIKVIDDAVEEGLIIGFITNKKLAESIDVYLGEYDFMTEDYNVLSEITPFEHRNDEYLVILNCRNEEYKYYIFHYKLNEKIDIQFEELYIFSDKAYAGLDRMTIHSDFYSINGYIKMDSEDIYHILEEQHEDNKVEDTKTESKDDYQFINFSNIFNKFFDNVIVEKKEDLEADNDNEECIDCCVDCLDTDCEYQGDKSDCECDSCIEERIDNCECEECNCDLHDEDDKVYEYDDYEQDKLICEYTDMILSTGGCADCIEDMLAEFSDKMRNIGWNEHKKYIDNCNKFNL